MIEVCPVPVARKTSTTVEPTLPSVTSRTREASRERAIRHSYPVRTGSASETSDPLVVATVVTLGGGWARRRGACLRTRRRGGGRDDSPDEAERLPHDGTRIVSAGAQPIDGVSRSETVRFVPVSFSRQIACGCVITFQKYVP